jgi:small subunit ribosomal protein S6
MRIYENLFIVKPDATEEEIDHLVDQMSKNVTAAGGTIDKVDKWGKRRLAYRIEKHREGSYVLMQFSAEPAIVREFERRLRVQDSVIKFLTVRIDEEQKRLDKIKAIKDARRKAPPAAPPAPAEAAGEAPAVTA